METTTYVEQDPRGVRSEVADFEFALSMVHTRQFVRDLGDGTHVVCRVEFVNYLVHETVEDGCDMALIRREMTLWLCTDPADPDGTLLHDDEDSAQIEFTVRDERILGEWTEEWDEGPREYLPLLLCAAFDPRVIVWNGQQGTPVTDDPERKAGPLTYIDRSEATGGLSDGLCWWCEKAFGKGAALVVAREEDDPHMPLHFHGHCWPAYIERETTALGLPASK